MKTEPTPDLPERGAGGWGWATLGGTLAASVWIGLGMIHRGHHADSLIPVLVSLQRWTPFYWEQDRFGMLVPLLAVPVRDPLANLLLQGVLSIAGGLLLFLLLPRFVLRDGSGPNQGTAALAGTLAAASFVLLVPDLYRFDYLVTQPYGVGLTLAVAALVVADPGGRTRVGLALGLMILAHWVNNAGAVYLGPLVLARGLLELWADFEPARALGRELRAVVRAGPLRNLDVGRLVRVVARWAGTTPTPRALGLLGLGFGAGHWMMGQVRGAFTTNTEALPLRDWPDSWRRLAGTTAAGLAPGGWPLVTALAAAIGLVALGWGTRVREPRWSHRERSEVVRAALALAVGSVAVFLLIGTRFWLSINEWHYRYVEVAAVELAVAGWVLAVLPVRLAWGDRAAGRFAAVLAPLLLVGASVARDGGPSPASVRRDFDRRWGAMSRDLLDAGCTHLAGSYWEVWPGVFHANMVLRDRGETRTLWGISFRASPTMPLALRSVPRDRACLATPRPERGTPANLSGRDLEPLVEVAGRPTIRVFRPGPRPSGQRDPREDRQRQLAK